MDHQFPTLNIFPDEILLMIFHNISGHELRVNISKVCRRWDCLISSIILTIIRPGDVVQLHGGLKALLVTCYIPTLPGPSAVILRIATLIPNLRELTISIDYRLDETELKIIEKFNNLRHLDVFEKENNLDDETPIPYNVTSLVVNNDMGPGFLRKMEKKRIIREFHMYGKSVHYPPREMGRFLKYHSVHLTELTLRCSEFTDSRYKTISRCEGLTSLQLYCCAQMTAVGATHLTNLTNLRRLHVTGMRMVRIQSLLDFIEHLPRRIKELNLSYSWFGDEHCKALVARLPNLRSLELWRSRVTALRLVQLVKLLTALEDLDTDAFFVVGHIKALEDHPSLMDIRCRWFGQIRTRLNIKSAIEMVPGQYLREDEQGPRGGLFYYWLQDSVFCTLPDSPLVPGAYVVRKSSDYDLYEKPIHEYF